MSISFLFKKEEAILDPPSSKIDLTLLFLIFSIKESKDKLLFASNSIL